MLYQKLYGRDSELAEAVRHLSSRRCVLLYGEGGVGKSAMALELHKRLCEKDWHSFHVTLFTARKPFLQELLFGLSHYASSMSEKQIFSNSTTVNALLGDIYKCISQLKRCVCIVEVAKVPEAMRRDFLGLLQRGMLLVFVSRLRSVHRDIDDKLEKLRIDPLCDAASKDWVGDYALAKEVEDVEHLKKYVVRKSGGYPASIADAFTHWDDEPFLSRQSVENTPIKKPVKQRYLYIPVSVIFVVLLMANKYVSRVMHDGGDRISYVMGAVGGVLVLSYLLFALSFFKRTSELADAEV